MTQDTTKPAPTEAQQRTIVPPKNPLLKDKQPSDSPNISDTREIGEHPEDQSGG